LWGVLDRNRDGFASFEELHWLVEDVGESLKEVISGQKNLMMVIRELNLVLSIALLAPATLIYGTSHTSLCMTAYWLNRVLFFCQEPGLLSCSSLGDVCGPQFCPTGPSQVVHRCLCFCLLTASVWCWWLGYLGQRERSEAHCWWNPFTKNSLYVCGHRKDGPYSTYRNMYRIYREFVEDINLLRQEYCASFGGQSR
jgi:hypothetical protein